MGARGELWEGAMLSKIVQRYLDWRYPAPSTADVRAEVIAEHDVFASGVVKRFSRGNVNLKAGRFVGKPNPRLKSHKAVH